MSAADDKAQLGFAAERDRARKIAESLDMTMYVFAGYTYVCDGGSRGHRSGGWTSDYTTSTSSRKATQEEETLWAEVVRLYDEIAALTAPSPPSELAEGEFVVGVAQFNENTETPVALWVVDRVNGTQATHTYPLSDEKAHAVIRLLGEALERKLPPVAGPFTEERLIAMAQQGGK